MQRSIVLPRIWTSATRPSFRLARAATPTSRWGSSSTKIPTLGDIEPKNAEKFNSRQTTFRERQLEDARKKAEQVAEQARLRAERASKDNADSTAAATAAAEDPDSKHRSGRLSSFIYGTEEGRNLDKEIERSFSQMLARGKYVHSIVFHEVKPDKVEEYSALVGKWYPLMASWKDTHVNLVGSWRTEVGDCDTFVHILEYQQYSGFHSTLHTLNEKPEYREFESKLNKLVRTKRMSLMQEFSFWPTSPPRHLGGLFELRSYTLHPGNLLEWENHWRKGLEARRKVMEGVGAWFVQIGDLNTVHHLWQFANLEERKIRREESWLIEGWGNTVHKTVPLIQEMKSRILMPMPWSPVS